jgi:hypothetical protein
MTSVQGPLIHGNFPKKIQLDMSQCMGPDGTPMIHEITKKCTGVYSFKVFGLMFDDMIRKTGPSLDLRISAVCEGSIVKIQNASTVSK